jgi:hypothetical protein
MSEIKQVTVATRNPSRDDLGSVEIGPYVVEDGLLTMVSEEGVPVRNANGDLMTHLLAPGENAVVIAKRLRLKIWRSANSDEMSGFNRRIDYGPSEVV